MAVFRNFCRVAKTALFALLVCFCFLELAVADICCNLVVYNENNVPAQTLCYYYNQLGSYKYSWIGIYDNEELSNKITNIAPPSGAPSGFHFKEYYFEDTYHNSTPVLTDANGNVIRDMNIFHVCNAPEVAVRPTWEPNTYTVTFNTTGGTLPSGGVSSIQVTYGDTVPEITTDKLPTQSGAYFEGYGDDQYTGGNIYWSYLPYTRRASWDKTSNTTLYAIWRYPAKSYYKCPGESSYKQFAILLVRNGQYTDYDLNGKHIVAPNCPGYRWTGLYDATSGGNQYLDSYEYVECVLDGDCEDGLYWDKSTGANLYAQYEKLPNGFSFDVDDVEEGDELKITINAAGTFTIDWGDGDYESFTNDSPTFKSMVHEYIKDGNYRVTIYGTATGYPASSRVIDLDWHYCTNTNYSCYEANDKITKFYGSLGNVFPILSSSSVGSTQPIFESSFSGLPALTTVSADLLSGLSGAPETRMFTEMFWRDSNLQYFEYSNGTTVNYIPPTFFGNISTTNYITDQDNDSDWVALSMFDGTNVATTCPNGYEQYFTGFEDEYKPKVSCIQSASCSSNQMHYNGTCITPDFTLTTTNDTNEFAFHIIASGRWIVDWGDGTTEAINRGTYDDYMDDDDKYSHTYTTTGTHIIKMTGLATDYSGDDEISAINFSQAGYEDNIASISGSLGKMFPTLNGNNVPSFKGVFEDVDNMTGEIPANLFSGVSGCRDYMFQNAFTYGKFTKIPSGLFRNISSNCASVFENTFSNCYNLTTVEQNAFPQNEYCGDRSFAWTFENAESLTTIPNDMFKNNSGGCAEMFQGTFASTGLTSIPSGLFSDVIYGGDNMFEDTFGYAKITEVPSGLFNSQLLDNNWGASMFFNMFENCDDLTTIPADLFDGLSGTPSDAFLANMFKGDSNLQYFKYANGTTVNWIPPDFFDNLDNENYSSGPMSGIFNGTNIATSCPTGYQQYFTGFESDFDGHVSCVISANIVLSYIDSLTNMTIEATPTSCTYNTKFNLPDAPTKQGYKFNGWTLIQQ